jgi:pSer/pThr/pTyr-binding forkhead associated (FHA) protein
MLPPVLRSVSPQELAQRLAVERRGVPFLVFLDGEGHQRLVDLAAAGSALSIGRQASSAISLMWDSEVSRVHAVLECIGDDWTLADGGLSRNGSFVNGHRLRGRCRLADGDSITVGHTLLVFRSGAPGDLRTTDTSRDLSPPELSPAQLRVLGALCRPVAVSPYAAPPSNREIAEGLFLSVETVKSHLHDLFELFGIAGLPQNRKRAELVRQAFERGVVPPDRG